MPESPVTLKSIETQTDVEGVVEDVENSAIPSTSEDKKDVIETPSTVASCVNKETDDHSTEPSTSDKPPPDPEQQTLTSEEENKPERRNILKAEGLCCFRFYTNAAHRSFSLFGDDAQLSTRMLRFLLCSKRILLDMYGYITQITAGRSSFYATSCYSVRYHTQNIRLLAWIAYIIYHDDENLKLDVCRQETESCIDKQLVKLMYLAKKLNISVNVEDYFRTRVVDQLYNDIKFKVRETYGYFSEYIHYGIPPTQLFKTDDGINMPSYLRLMNDVERPQDFRIPTGEAAETLRRQKMVKIRESYLAEAFCHPSRELELRSTNFLTVLQYLPLPEMPKLNKFMASCKFQDLFTDGTFELYEIILADIKRAAPEAKVELTTLICVNCRDYTFQKDVMAQITEAFQRLLVVMRENEHLYLQAAVNIFMPVSEQGRQVDFFTDMSVISQFRSFRFEEHGWFYSSTVDNPPPIDGNRRAELDVECIFNDAVLEILGDKDIVLIE